MDPSDRRRLAQVTAELSAAARRLNADAADVTRRAARTVQAARVTKAAARALRERNHHRRASTPGGRTRRVSGY